MADVAGLGLKKREATNFGDYPQGGGGYTPPSPPGDYIGQAPSEFEFSANNGDLVAVMNEVKILDAPEGHQDTIRFERLSTTPYKQGKRAKGGACRAGDFLLSVGADVDFDTTDQQKWAEAIESAADGQFPFNLDWEVYASDLKKTLVRGYQNFPVDPNDPSKRLPFVEVEGPDGQPKRYAARQVIRYYKFGGK